MLKSMTGFGVGNAQTKKMRVSVELSSVNRKQMDIALRLPSQLHGHESRIQKVIHQRISRGRVTGAVLVEITGDQPTVTINEKRAAPLIQALRDGAKKWGLRDDLNASLLLRMPDVLDVQSVDQDPEELFRCVEKALKTALKNLIEMRSTEGRELTEDFVTRLNTLEEKMVKIKKQAPRVTVKARKKLLQAMKEADLKGAEKDERIIREIALFGEKADITEEITRLESHIKQFRSKLRSSAPVGRELDFLLQEFLREINTIGSKANDLNITKQVVAFKTELERVREQVQNVE